MLKFSENTNELDAALSLFQGEMPVIKKDVNVKMNGVSKSGKEFKVDYDYAPLESIQEKANSLLAKHGLNVTQNIGFELIGNDFIHVIHTRVGHKSGQWILSTWPLDMSGVTKEQDRGSKITFNKRYAFVAALNIALSDEDNDAVGVEISLGDMVVHYTGPSINGKKLKDIDKETLNKALEYWKNKNPTGNLAYELQNIEKYLKEGQK